MQTLEVGSSGVEVELWQSFLNRTGYPVGSVDGSFGVVTHGATEAFQKANKLTPDGIVGNATLAVAIGRGFKPIISRGTSPPRAESYVIAEIRYRNCRVGLQYSTEREWTMMLTDRPMPTIQKIPAWM
jgi:peptidoglycan hydrolase-like protein with peptidoglycan-binding domain